MNITSPQFALFALVTLFIYYLLPRRAQNGLLLLASYVFLASWALEFAAVFALLTLVNFWLAQRLPQNRAALGAGVVVNVAALVFFKYSAWFLPDGALGLKILLPVGLSFYIVQAISYLMDIHKGLAEPERDPLDFALYMAYFPRVTSGPIERARDFLPRLKTPRRLDEDLFARSITLLLLGIFRKMVLADVLLTFLPQDIFATPDAYNTPDLWLWLFVYAFALYNDFAGYTNIARGVSGFFGIELSANFNTPYLARNFTEFWQRWHISLSDWLRDYIFTPLLRGLLRRKFNTRHPLTIVAPPMATMLVSGLWHDASWNMLLWGGLHGLFQVYERLRAVWRPSPPPQNHPAWRQVGAIALVVLLSVLAWVPFRMQPAIALDYWRGMVGTGTPTLDTIAIIALFLIFVTLCLDVFQYRKGELAFTQYPPIVKAVFINIVIFSVILATAAQGSAPPPFIYQGF